MTNSPEKTVRLIARSAQRKIRKKTGMTVSLLLHPQGNDALKTPEQMMEVIAPALDMNTHCYKMRSREREIVELRFIAAMLMRIHFPYITLQQIAVLFGGLDHTSIISGLTRGNNLIHTGDPRFTRKYDTALTAVNTWLLRMNSIAA